MRNTPLSELRRKNKYFYRNIGIVKPGRRKKTTLEYIIERSYDALPKLLKEYIEDKEQIKEVLVNTIIQSGESGEINPYEALKQYAKYRQKSNGDNTKRFIWNRFKEEHRPLYNKYNSYIYRLGFSSVNYFMKNVELSQQGSQINATLNLPKKLKGVTYETLEIFYDFSGADFYAYME